MANYMAEFLKAFHPAFKESFDKLVPFLITSTLFINLKRTWSRKTWLWNLIDFTFPIFL